MTKISRSQNVTTTGQVDANHYVVTLDLDYTGATFPTIQDNERAVQVLAKPSDHIVAYFEDTEGLVEGVNEAFYSNKIVVQEIGASARRTAAQDTTSDAVNGSGVWDNSSVTSDVSTLGLTAANTFDDKLG